MPTVYHDEDADLSALDGETVAILGYGSQGRPQALNLRDSGVDVIVGNVHDDSWERAEEDGFDVYPVAEAAARADVVTVLVPDEFQADIFEADIEPGLSAGDALVFSHGYNIYYGFLEPPADVDVVMVAPKMIGPAVRDLFERGEGVPGKVAVEQDATGRAMDRTLAYAKGVGATMAGAIESTFEEETVLDIFCEQMMAGGSMATIMVAYEVLTAEGYDPLTVLFNLYLSGEAIEESRLRAKEGLFDQLSNHSRTSQYGQLTRGLSMADEETRATFREHVEEIRNGEFAREWTLEQQTGFAVFNKLWDQLQDHEITDVEQQAREQLNFTFE